MATIRLMHAKLHRVTVTEANVNYVGSITIDPDLMNQVGILPLEEVDVINLNNGKRWSTYAIPGEKAGTGEICPNGGAALLCQPGDLLIIIAYETRDRATVMKEGHQAQVVVVDQKNRPQDLIRQNLIPQGEGVQLKSTSYNHSSYSPR
ncbi:MAG: aspartate 1-decarboxylase [Xenococcaceae cyanobacterium MO_167.B52]|nr:aspartate 1-decarboxylase [Xenococcaceae cyanobacterium MO_167.B52]